MRNQSSVSRDQLTDEPVLNPSLVSAVNRLTNACRDAALTTQQAVNLTLDPAFHAWLEQLCKVHEQSISEFERLLEANHFDVQPRHSIGSRARRCWMRCSVAVSAGSPLAMMSACRREEYRVQAAYELALWVLPAGHVRDTVENRFQQFILHRSMIPAGRLPQTRQFLQQAERLQQIHSSDTPDVPPGRAQSRPLSIQTKI